MFSLGGMWQRKSDAEIHAFQRRRPFWKSRYNPIWPFFSAVLLAAIVIVHKYSGAPNKYAGLTTPVPFVDAFWSSIPAFIFAFIFGYLLLLRFPRALTPPGDAREFFCPRCRQPCSPRRWTEAICACGAQLEPIDWWRWHDERVRTT